jgi:hypothetical protein
MLTLNDDDARVLADTLTHDLSELRMEISHTDRMDFREGLKEKKAALGRIVDALESSLIESS